MRAKPIDELISAHEAPDVALGEVFLEKRLIFENPGLLNATSGTGAKMFPPWLKLGRAAAEGS